MQQVILDEVYADDIIELENRVNNFVEEQKGYKLISTVVKTHFTHDGTEFLGAQMALVVDEEQVTKLYSNGEVVGYMIGDTFYGLND